MPGERKELLLQSLLPCVTHREPGLQGDPGGFRPSPGLSGCFLKPKYLWFLLAGLRLEAMGREGTPGIKNDKALSFDTAIGGIWKQTYFSNGRQFQQLCLCTEEQDSELARDGLQHSRRKTDD